MRVSWFVVLLSRFIVGRGSTSAAELIDTSVSTLLRDDHDADASERAARQLMDLAYECPENVQSIMRSGALEPLVRLLGGGGPGAREAAAGALIDLSQTDADRIAVVRAGAIAPSVELLAVAEASCTEAAAGLLTTLVVVARGAVVGPLVKAVAANPGNGTKARNAASATQRVSAGSTPTRAESAAAEARTRAPRPPATTQPPASDASDASAASGASAGASAASGASAVGASDASDASAASGASAASAGAAAASSAGSGAAVSVPIARLITSRSHFYPKGQPSKAKQWRPRTSGASSRT